MDVKIYEAQADIISVDDIAKNSNNRIVMRRIKRNEADADDDNNSNENDENKALRIRNYHGEDGGGCIDYVPEGVYDMGWLGYFVGKNEHLQELIINPFIPTSGSSLRDVMEPFLRGVSQNKSIRAIDFSNVDLLGGEMFTMLGSFFQNIYNLTTISISNCVWGDEGGRLFALALGNCTNKSLKIMHLEENNIADEGMVDIIAALSMYPHLQHLDLDGNHLRKNGCVALATLIQCSAKELQNLYISNNGINDDGIEALVPALTNCNCLEELRVCDNPSITTRGWQSLASILESPNSNLQELYITRNNIDDEAAATFANALAKNHTLHTLDLDNNPSITAVGWQSFSKLLCNTSSVNATFLSNHALLLLSMGNIREEANEIIGPLLRLNDRDDKKEVAKIKILQCHNDFDMLPFFEWEFKVLPLAINWLERASEYEIDFEPNIERRKLSTIYQFVRGMPLLYVEARLRKELEDIKAEESQLEEDKESQEEFMQRKRYLQERKESIMQKLGGKLQHDKI